MLKSGSALPRKEQRENNSRVNWLCIFPQISGYWAIVIGSVVIIAWYAHWKAVIQLLPHLPPMKYNTALGFVLSGVGLALLSTRYAKMASWFGIIVALIGSLTLAEYLTDRSFGIDQLFIQSYIETATSFAGRMSPLTASCFVIFGAALALTGGKTNSKVQLTAIGLLSCIVAMIAGVALMGYVFGIEITSGWGSYTRMAVHTAVTFFFINIGLLVWAWQKADQRKINFLRWLPVTGAVTLMGMIALTSIASFAELSKSSYWQKHTYDVIEIGQTLLGNFTDMQRGMRGYVLSGQPEALALYQDGVGAIPGQLDQLKSLIIDNPDQQVRLHTLHQSVDDVIMYSHRLLSARESRGIQGAVELESTGEGLAVMNRARADLQAFIGEERRLLKERTAVLNADFNNTKRLVIFGSVLAAALLVLANLMASREMNFRRRAEAELQEVTSLQKAILNSANHAIISCGVDGMVTTFNKTAERWLGYSAEEVIGKNTPGLWHDGREIAARAEVLSRELGREIKPGFEVFIAKVRPEKSDESEWTFTRKDGSHFPVLLSASAMTDVTGKIIGYIGVITDISKRRKAEAAQRASDKAVRDQAQILDLANDTIFVRDLDDKITYWNQGAQRVYGWSREEMIGRVTHSVLHTDFPQPLEEIRAQLMARGHWEGELVHTRRDGTHITVVSRWTLQEDEAGKPARIIEMNYDITERKKMERALHENNIELQSAAEAKDKFLANMSHELRTPLNGIIGFSQLLADEYPGPVNAEQKEYLEDVLNSSHHLLQLINDVLDLAKVGAGKMELHPDTFSLSKAIEQVCSVAYPLIQKKKIHVTTTIVPELDQVTIDQQKFKQILYNLLSNAIKFTEERGKIDIMIAKHGEDQFTLAVKDTGIGIKPEDMKRLFKEFEQLETGATKNYGGTGLGLALVRKIVEIQGGSIKAESEYGHGSTFTALLPIRMKPATS